MADRIADAPAEFKLRVESGGEIDYGSDWRDSDIWVRFEAWRARAHGSSLNWG